jgi:hypothetical protein
VKKKRRKLVEELMRLMEKVIERYPCMKEGEERMICRTKNYNYCLFYTSYYYTFNVKAFQVISKYSSNIKICNLLLNRDVLGRHRIKVLKYYIEDFRMVLEK